MPAKINLALCVGAPRADGFHPLATVYQAVSLFDEVHAAWGDPGEFAVTVTGEGAAEVPTDDRNLAIRAARLLADRYGEGQPLGVSMAIHKAIPVAGGLAGGSSNGAAALLACADLWALDVSLDQMLSLAAELGSDVPFALLGGTALGSGRGEQVAPVLGRGSYHWVLGFGRIGSVHPGGLPDLRRAPARRAGAGGAGRADGRAALRRCGPPGAGAGQRPAGTGAASSAPAATHAGDGTRLRSAGGHRLRLGPDVAFLAKSEASAIDLCVALTADGVVRTARRAVGPVPGARLIG